MTRTHPIRSVFMLLLGGLVVATILHYIGYLATAHAAAAADPVAAATAATDTGWSLVTQYGPLWAGAIIAMGIGQTFLKQQHWLAQGRTLALITGAVSTLGAVLAWKFSGAPVEGIVITAIMALKLAWSPNVASAAKPVGAGAGAVLALLVLGLAGPQLACAGSSAAVKREASYLEGCSVADATVIITAGKALADDAKTLKAGGDRAAAATDVIVQLALINGAWQHCKATATQPTALRPSSLPAVAALERLRANFGGVRWRTATGEL